VSDVDVVMFDFLSDASVARPLGLYCLRWEVIRLSLGSSRRTCVVAHTCIAGRVSAAGVEQRHKPSTTRWWWKLRLDSWWRYNPETTPTRRCAAQVVWVGWKRRWPLMVLREGD